MKRIHYLLMLLVGVAGFAIAQIPPYGIYVTQADVTTEFFWGRYFVPPNPTNSYVLMYHGGDSKPRMGAIGSGLTWDGTTLDASGGSGVTSVTAGTGLTGGTITSTGTIALSNVGTAGTYSSVTTDAQGRVTAGTSRSFNYTTRTLNTCFQVSATRDALVSYAVDIATSLSLTAGQQGTAYLRTYTNSGCSAGVQEVTRFVNGQTGTLTIGLALTQNVTGTLTGVIPAGLYAQIVTENNTGTPTFTARPGQETLL